MIILKATQDKVLSALQSVAGIVERRHTLPMLANVLLRKAGAGFLEQSGQAVPSPVSALRPHLTSAAHRGGPGGVSSSLRPNGFFSASKANLRNAP